MKVFNADFFLGRDTHYLGYLDYRIDLVRTFYGHDVLRNIRLMQHCCRIELTKVDDMLREILDLGETQILDRVATRLAEWPKQFRNVHG
jgi:hypothetical protein